MTPRKADDDPQDAPQTPAPTGPDPRDEIAEHLAAMRAFAVSLTRDPVAADDLVQDTCLRALSRHDQWDPNQPLDRWVFRIARNLWISELRKRKVRLDLEGKPALTRWEVAERFRGYALLRAWPETGRTHQIRVHLSHLGCPLVGDALYGSGAPLLLSKLKAGYRAGKRSERPLIERTALHAVKLRFKDPSGEEPTTVESPLPKDFRVALKQLRKHAPT